MDTFKAKAGAQCRINEVKHPNLADTGLTNLEVGHPRLQTGDRKLRGLGFANHQVMIPMAGLNF